MKTMKTEKAVWSRVTAYSGSFYTKRRRIFLTALMAATAVFFCAVLFVTQIINGDSYALKQSSSRTYTVPVEAPRGNILDSTGQKMAYNSQSNELLFDASAFPPSSRQGERNAEILALIQLLERRGPENRVQLRVVVAAQAYQRPVPRELPEQVHHRNRVRDYRKMVELPPREKLRELVDGRGRVEEYYVPLLYGLHGLLGDDSLLAPVRNDPLLVSRRAGVSLRGGVVHEPPPDALHRVAL